MFRNKTKNNNSYKKLPCKKLFAFTLAEILLVFSFIGIVAVAYAVDSHSKIDSTQKKLLLYNAFKSLDLASTEIARTYVIDTEGNTGVPNDGETFCNALAEIFNTVGEINCSSSLSSFGVDFKTPNFISTNGMSFYNVAAAPIADISDANMLISSSELNTARAKAQNKANAEIDDVMDKIKDEAEEKAKKNLPSRNYVVNLTYTKIEPENPEYPKVITKENGSSYELHLYNYNVDYDHEGVRVKTSQAYTNNATCYEIKYDSNSNLIAEDLLNIPACTNVETKPNETLSVASPSNDEYKAIKDLIDLKYNQSDNVQIQQKVADATSASVRAKELDKLYQSYYNQYFQELFKKYAGSLPTVHNVYIDINGSRGNSKVNEDVFLFLVRSDGKTVPSRNSELANNTNIISAGYYTRNNTAISAKVSFREAACRTNRFLEVDYNNKYGYCYGYSVDTTNCPRKKACYYKINQPKSMWSLF